MSQKVTVHNVDDYTTILLNSVIASTQDFNSTVFVSGIHNTMGNIIGVSNAEECFVIELN